jgi:hypothetical protein
MAAEETMNAIRAIAVPTETAQQVLATMKSPGYGHPAHTELAKGHGPCRHCLQPFRVGEETRTLFTYNPFQGIAPIPSPGPVFIHADACERFEEVLGYPAGLLPFPVALDGYDREQKLVRQRTAEAGEQESAIREMFLDDAIRYVLVRDLKAGCFDFRAERSEAS